MRPKITTAMVVGGIGGFFLGRYVYDRIAVSINAVSRHESAAASGEAVVAGVIGAGVVAAASNILSLVK